MSELPDCKPPVETTQAERDTSHKLYMESRVAELAESLLKLSFGSQQYPQSPWSCISAAQAFCDALEQRRNQILNPPEPPKE